MARRMKVFKMKTNVGKSSQPLAKVSRQVRAHSQPVNNYKTIQK